MLYEAVNNAVTTFYKSVSAGRRGGATFCSVLYVQYSTLPARARCVYSMYVLRVGERAAVCVCVAIWPLPFLRPHVAAGPRRMATTAHVAGGPYGTSCDCDGTCTGASATAAASPCTATTPPTTSQEAAASDDGGP